MFPKRIPLHFTLLSIITLLISSVVAILVTSNYIRSSEVAVTIADDLMVEVNDKVLIRIDSLFKPITALAERVSELPDLASKPDMLTHPACGYFYTSLTSYPYIYSVYMGFADDDFFQIISLPPEDKQMRETLGTPESTRFIVRRILRREDGKRVEVWKFLDAERSIVGSRKNTEVTFRPTTRPWYEAASDVDEVIRTAPYPFTSSRSLGITVARRFDGDIPGVFGVDLTLTRLSDFLSRQKVGKSGVVLLFQGSGELIAHPNIKETVHVVRQGNTRTLLPVLLADLSDPVVQAFYQAFLDCGGRCGPIRFEVEGTTYFGRITSISDDYMPNSFCAVLAPLKDYTAPLEKERRNNLIFALVVLILVLPIVFLLSRQIAGQLLRLSNEAEKISRFTLDDDPQIASHITEVQKLALAFASMKDALRTFGQYVPQSLVQKIVRKEMSTKLGGSRQPLTVLFTDIADFTTISEASDPEALMQQISEYFQLVGGIFIQEGGTIDKFIGDAVMAFWNAPTPDPDHVHDACTAALNAAKASNALNEKWREQGKAVFHTRFGIHTGDCIVGNVGSSDRMDYTAMGDVVNTSSRLEGLNKYYSSQILVGKSVRDRAGDTFLFRTIGKVVPKGKTEPAEIFELVDRADAVDSDYYKAWEEAYAAFIHRDFDRAQELFKSLHDQKPEDRPVGLFLKRAEEFSTNPPPEDWCGVEIFAAK